MQIHKLGGWQLKPRQPEPACSDVAVNHLSVPRPGYPQTIPPTGARRNLAGGVEVGGRRQPQAAAEKVLRGDEFAAIGRHPRAAVQVQVICDLLWLPARINGLLL